MILTLQKASRLKLSFDSRGYGVKNPTFYVLDLVCDISCPFSLNTKFTNLGEMIFYSLRPRMDKCGYSTDGH